MSNSNQLNLHIGIENIKKLEKLAKQESNKLKCKVSTNAYAKKIILEHIEATKVK